MDARAVLSEIDALRLELDAAVDGLLSAAQRGLDAGPDAEAARQLFAEVMALCAFHDLSGQRLDRIARTIARAPADVRPDARLLNGPAGPGGLDQAAADALFEARADR